MRPPDRTFWLLFLVLGAAWGSSYLFIAIAIRVLDPFTLVAARLAIGTAVLGAVLAAGRRPLPCEPRVYLDLAIVAVLNLVVPFSLTSWGQESVDSGVASVLNATIPLFTVVLAAGLLADERLTPSVVAGLAVGFGGVVALTAPGLHAGPGGSLAGDAALLASSASYAAANVFVRRRLRGLDPTAMAFFQVAFAFLATTALALAFERPFDAHPAPETVVSILWLGLVASGLAYVGFFRLVDGWGSTRTSTIAYVLPVVGVALGWLVLGERVDARVVGGAVLVIAGIALANGTQLGRPLVRRAQAVVGRGGREARRPEPPARRAEAACEESNPG